MSNSLFNILEKSMPQNDLTNMVNQFRQFKKNLNGNPKDIVMNMLSSGKISQAQLNQAQQMANQYIDILK